MKTMRAAVMVAPRQLEIQEVVLPEPKPGQVRLRLEGCGVCGSNLPPYEGREWFRYPFAPGAPGHEGWGVVDAVGRGVTSLAEGDRVAALSFAAYAEYDVVDAASAVKLPPALDGQPFPGEPLGCAVNVFRRADVRPGQTVAVIGIGFLGALVSRLCCDAGAQVIAISRRPFALEVAKRLGAHALVPMDDHNRIIERVGELTGGRFCERVIEAVGQQWPLDLAGELTAERGRLVIAGYHQDGLRRVNLTLWNWRGIDVVNAHERNADVSVEGMALAADAAASGRLDVRSLITHAFPLDDIGDAFEAMRCRPEGFLKAVVTAAPNV